MATAGSMKPSIRSMRRQEYGKGKEAKKSPPKKPGMSNDKRSGKPSPLRGKK